MFENRVNQSLRQEKLTSPLDLDSERIRPSATWDLSLLQSHSEVFYLSSNLIVIQAKSFNSLMFWVSDPNMTMFDLARIAECFDPVLFGVGYKAVSILFRRLPTPDEGERLIKVFELWGARRNGLVAFRDP